MPRKASPLSSPTLSVISLGAIFSFVTWCEFSLELHFIWLEFACCYLKLCFASFISIKVARIAFTMLILQVYELLFQNRKFIDVAKIPEKCQNVIKCWNILHNKLWQIFYSVIIFQNFWSSRSMVRVQITTDGSVFDRFCFQCIVCLFPNFYGLYCSI